MRRSSRLLVLPAILLSTLVACGDDDDDDTSATTAPTSAVDGSSVATTAVAGTDGTTAASTSGSGGGEVAAQQEYVDAASDEIGEDFGDLADCAAEALINDDVYAAIQQAGLTLDQFKEDGPVGLALDDSAVQGVGADLAACGDVLGQVIPSDEEEAVACAEQHITNEQAAAAIAYDVLGAEPNAELQTAIDDFQACIDETTATT